MKKDGNSDEINLQLAHERTELSHERTDLSIERRDLAQERTHLANERTFQAWIRTSLSLIGFGFAMQKFIVFLKEENTNELLHFKGDGVFSWFFGVLFIFFGVLMMLFAYLRYEKLSKKIGYPKYMLSRWFPLVVTIVIMAGGIALLIDLFMN